MPPLAAASALDDGVVHRPPERRLEQRLDLGTGEEVEVDAGEVASAPQPGDGVGGGFTAADRAHQGRGTAVDELMEQRRRRRVQPLQVVDEDDRSPTLAGRHGQAGGHVPVEAQRIVPVGSQPGGKEVDERAERDRRRRDARARPPRRPTDGLQPIEHLVGQARLAHPGWAVDHDAGRRVVDQRVEAARQFVAPADERPPQPRRHHRGVHLLVGADEPYSPPRR